MKVVAINGSPKKEGNTYHALSVIEKQLEMQGIEMEILHIGNKAIHGCTACGKCAQMKNEQCSITNDIVNESIQKMKAADGIIIAAPVYFSGIPGTMKSFLDRAFYVSGSNGALFRQKVAAAVVAVRRTGGSVTFDNLNHYLTYSQMIIATSNYWNVIHGRLPGEVLQDEEGVQAMEVLANNMAWLLKMKQHAEGVIHPPERVTKAVTNFIR